MRTQQILGHVGAGEAEGEREDRSSDAQHVRVDDDDAEEWQELRASRLRGTSSMADTIQADSFRTTVRTRLVRSF